MDKPLLTVVTRKGQITLPIEIRRLLDIKEGDKIAVSVAETEAGAPARIIVEPIRSVAEYTFGAVKPRKRPLDLEELRRQFEEGMAQQATARLEDE